MESMGKTPLVLTAGEAVTISRPGERRRGFWSTWRGGLTFVAAWTAWPLFVLGVYHLQHHDPHTKTHPSGACSSGISWGPSPAA